MASSVITIPKRVTGREELVIIPKREYEMLKKAHPNVPAFAGYEMHTWKGKKYKVPAYQLHGKAAERLDREVREAIAEYKAGKTIAASSMGEALKKYARRKKDT